MSRCNHHTRNYVWMNKRQQEAFSKAWVELDRKNLDESDRKTSEEFADEWLSGRDLRNDPGGVLERFVLACRRHGIRITYLRKPSGTPDDPGGEMYETEWYRAEVFGSYWPAFHSHAEGKKPKARRTYRTREERLQMKADYRFRCIEAHKHALKRAPKVKKRKLTPGKLLPTVAKPVVWRPKMISTEVLRAFRNWTPPSGRQPS